MNFEPYLGRFPETIRISNSEIQMFKEDRRRWYLTYYLGLRRKERSFVGPLPLGTRVHQALEVYFRDNEDPISEYTRLLREERHQLEQFGDPSLEEDAFNSEGELGRIMIEGFVQWVEEELVTADYEIVGVEGANSAKVMDGRVELIGKTDLKLLDNRDGGVYIGDLKTAAQLKQYYDTSHMSEQLMLYTLLERLQNTGTPADGGVYLVMKKVKRTVKAKPPFYEKFTIRFNEATINSFWIRLNGTLRDMLYVRDELDKGADHRYVAYPSITNDSTWKDPFFDVSHMFDDGSDAERWLLHNTEVVDPYERYEDVLQ